MSAILEAANDARSLVADEVVEIANRLRGMTLFPDEIAVLLDGIRDALLMQSHLKVNAEMAEELATLADWVSKEQQ